MLTPLACSPSCSGEFLNGARPVAVLADLAAREAGLGFDEDVAVLVGLERDGACRRGRACRSGRWGRRGRRRRRGAGLAGRGAGGSVVPGVATGLPSMVVLQPASSMPPASTAASSGGPPVRPRIVLCDNRTRYSRKFELCRRQITHLWRESMRRRAFGMSLMTKCYRRAAVVWAARRAVFACGAVRRASWRPLFLIAAWREAQCHHGKVPLSGSMVAGILLAAGAGRRYGKPKVLVEGWLEAAVGALRGGGCDDVVPRSWALPRWRPRRGSRRSPPRGGVRV